MEMSGNLPDYKGYKFNYSGQYLVQLDTSRNITWSDYLCYPWAGFDKALDLQANGDSIYLKEFNCTVLSSTGFISLWTDSGNKYSKAFYGARELGYSMGN